MNKYIEIIYALTDKMIIFSAILVFSTNLVLSTNTSCLLNGNIIFNSPQKLSDITKYLFENDTHLNVVR